MQSTKVRNDYLNHVFRGIPMPAPAASLYVGLFTTQGEVDAAAYVRQPITFSEPFNGLIYNMQDIHFPVAAEYWGQVVEAQIYDDPIAGEMKDRAAIKEVKVIKENQLFTIPAGTYEIEVG